MSSVIEEGQKPQAARKENDLSKGSVINNILKLALPMTLAQLINVLYNIVDRVYIDVIPEDATLSLTGLSLCPPIISTVIALANLFGMGGAPLCSIERGRDNKKEAKAIMGNTFVMMAAMGILLTILGLIFKRPMLCLFGASDTTISYTGFYIAACLLGSIFVMTGLGMNSFINSQGFGIVGMMTVLLGTITNIILNPILIFVFHMGVRGAVLATISSQYLSVIRILTFLTGKRAILKLRPSTMKLEGGRIPRIAGLGMSGFTMAITNSSVQVIYNAMFRRFGENLYVRIITVISSVREVISMPVNGMTSSSQPVIDFSYGAGEYGRVRESIVFVSMAYVIYIVIIWLSVRECPEFFIRIFNREEELAGAGIPAICVYFFGFSMISLQFSGQAVLVGLGKSKKAVFFSIFRKMVIMIPLILMLPTVFDLGTTGVLMAKPMSNLIGGVAYFGTVLFAV